MGYRSARQRDMDIRIALGLPKLKGKLNHVRVRGLKLIVPKGWIRKETNDSLSSDRN